MFRRWVCKHCQFAFVSSVLSVMSVTAFPLIIMSAHAQCSICTCSVEGISSLVCLHTPSVASKMKGFWQRWRKILKNPSSSPHNDWTDKTDNTEDTNANWQSWPSLHLACLRLRHCIMCHSYFRQIFLTMTHTHIHDVYAFRKCLLISVGGSSGRVRGKVKKHVIYAATLGSHLFYGLFLQDRVGGRGWSPWPPGSATGYQ